jgi:hypothetical protein
MDSLVLELKDLLQRETTEPPDDFFTRRLHERIAETRLSTPVPRWQTVSISDLTVLEEHWTLGQLLTFPIWHHKARPCRSDLPLVIFRGWGIAA